MARRRRDQRERGRDEFGIQTSSTHHFLSKQVDFDQIFRLNPTLALPKLLSSASQPNVSALPPSTGNIATLASTANGKKVLNYECFLVKVDEI